MPAARSPEPTAPKQDGGPAAEPEQLSVFGEEASAVAEPPTEEEPFWSERRVFSKFEAWYDLARLASGREEAMLKASRIALAPGETPPLSRRALAVRWGWTEQRVCHFLRLLREMGQIEVVRKLREGQTYRLTPDRVVRELAKPSATTAGERNRAGKGRQPAEEVTQEQQPPQGSEPSLEPEPEQQKPKPWSSRVIDVWRELAGEPPIGHLVAALKPVYDELGGDADRLCYGLAKWLAAGNAKFGPSIFARDWRKWTPGGRMPLPGLSDLAAAEFIAQGGRNGG